ncbi:MAG: protease modulator HflC [Alphaproteobacteria bacterium GWF2_58_20]|nr:MAG: protease modulator HflC [Alphaproteobacteria bacterium GWF2_58_20]
MMFVMAGFAAILLVGAQSLFTVSETEQVLLTRFGEPMWVVRDPGLHAKVPFLDEVHRMDKRILDLDPPAEEVLLSDQKRLVVDAFARYRIMDPLRFYQTVRVEETAASRLDNLVISAMRRVMGNVDLKTVLFDGRVKAMGEIRDQVNAEVGRLGIEVVDVRIGRADLPDATLQSVFARMRSEREREAAEFRAQGQQMAQETRSKAERERTVIIAEAERAAQVRRGEGDKQAIAIQAKAFGQDAEFYAFYRSLEAYRKGLAGGDSTLVLAPDGKFFQYFNGKMPK